MNAITVHDFVQSKCRQLLLSRAESSGSTILFKFLKVAADFISFCWRSRILPEKLFRVSGLNSLLRKAGGALSWQSHCSHIKASIGSSEWKFLTEKGYGKCLVCWFLLLSIAGQSGIGFVLQLCGLNFSRGLFLKLLCTEEHYLLFQHISHDIDHVILFGASSWMRAVSLLEDPSEHSPTHCQLRSIWLAKNRAYRP